MDNRQVAFTDHCGIRVSTIFSGIADPFSSNPLFFETMIFGGDNHGSIVKYATWQDAEEGHKEIVKELLQELFN
jgi:hypothetical protein